MRNGKVTIFVCVQIFSMDGFYTYISSWAGSHLLLLLNEKNKEIPVIIAYSHKAFPYVGS